jgi:ribonuclease I
MRAVLKRFSPLAALPASAQDFDYYLLTRAWTPSWCLAGGGDSEQCDPLRDLGFTLHGR